MFDSIKNQTVFFKRPNFLLSLMRVKNHVYTDVLTLNAEFATTKEPVPYAERKTLQYAKIEKGGVWASEQFDCGWFHFTGKLNVPIDKLFGIFAFEGEACVYDDDGVVQGLTSVMSTGDMFQPTCGKQIVEASKLNIDKDGNVDVWVETGKNGAIMKIGGGASHLKRAVIAKRRDDIYELYFDLLILQQYANALKKCPEKKEINAGVHKAFSVLGDFSAEKVQAAREILAPFYAGGNDNPFEISAVGHAHLDLAWLWPLRESHRKAERTYSNALYEIEKHDGYIFGSSQPQQFEWIKDARPSLYEKIKKAVADGRIETQGIMWVEPDTNVPSGESLIRQCYYGKNFFRDEFGVEMDYLWVPDVFGYTASLPRILNGSGVDKFMTIKLSWNTINKFPYHSFNWKGIGESNVLVHMPPEGDYNSQCNPYATKKIESNYRERAVSNVSLMPFGCGDGGGGPGEYHVQSIERQSKIKYNLMPRIRFCSAKDFFKKLETEKAKLPSYEGELYLEKHQGTYTSQSVMKRDMRRAERLLHNTEFICTLAMLRNAEYPKKQLDKIWKNTLLHQFHDILPGSSINRVYKEAHPNFLSQEAQLIALQNEAIKYLKGNTKYIINDISFARKGYIKYENSWFEYDVKPYATAELVPFSGGDAKSYESVLENSKIKATFNKNGEIVELLDKTTNINSVGKAFNSMRIYTDSKMIPYDAWDINIKYTRKFSSLMKLMRLSATLTAHAQLGNRRLRMARPR
jgi:Alpha-mannosidase